MDDDAAVTAFIQRLDERQLNGHLMDELSHLSYDQLLLLGKTLAEWSLNKSEK